jgi:leucyl/phenylalanyl-tRNA--protein transferase
VWNTESGALVGGIYGLALGSCFTAESMFHRETDASKVAFASMVELLRPTFTIFDAEVPNPHLDSLGCVPLPRAQFLERLEKALQDDVAFPRLG